jgi:hypothetical protein
VYVSENVDRDSRRRLRTRLRPSRACDTVALHPQSVSSMRSRSIGVALGSTIRIGAAKRRLHPIERPGNASVLTTRGSRRRVGLALAFIALVAAGCAQQSTAPMTTRPPATAGSASAERKVVLFRVVLDVDGKQLDEPWSLHLNGLRLFTVVGPADASLAALDSFLPGQLGATAASDGWAFVALPAGAYQLQFEGAAIHFAMAGAQYNNTDAVAFGRSPPSVFVLPADGSLFYIGTFSFSCQQLARGMDSARLECKTLRIDDETQLAQPIARLTFDAYGPMRRLPAAIVEQKGTR